MSKLMYNDNTVAFQKMRRIKGNGKNNRKLVEIQRTRQFEEARLNKYIIPVMVANN